MKMMIFLLMLAALLGTNIYVFVRLWQMMPPVPVGRVLLAVSAVVATASLFVGIAAGDSLPFPLARFFYKLGTSWFFISLYLLLLFLLRDLLRAVRLLPDSVYSGWAVVLLTALLMTSGYFVYRHKKRVELRIASPVPMKIVAASDLHLGYGIGADELREWVGRINREKPDLVLFAGDLIDNSVRAVRAQDLAPVLRGIDAPLGVFAVPGNHEYISGIENSLGFLREAGIRVLRDSVALAGGVYVVGRDDRTNRARKTLAELTEPLDRTKPVILLDHQPYGLDEAREAGVDFQFSGHTHRGQVVPASWVTDALYEKSYGLLQKGKTHYYISSGLGIWGGKFRIGTRSEYVVIELVAGK